MQPEPEPVILPDVATEPHPTAHAIPEPPGSDADQHQEVVLDHKEPAEMEEGETAPQPPGNTGQAPLPATEQQGVACSAR
jgi:hypothetical protein